MGAAPPRRSSERPHFPAGVAVDGQHLYWANFYNGTIARSNLDGSGVNQNFITGEVYPYGVAVDGQHIYWVNYGTGTIMRANLDGSGTREFDQRLRRNVRTVRRRCRRPAHLLVELHRRHDRARERRRQRGPAELDHRRRPSGRGGGRRPACLLDEQRHQHGRGGEPRRQQRERKLHHRRERAGAPGGGRPASVLGQ